MELIQLQCSSRGLLSSEKWNLLVCTIESKYSGTLWHQIDPLSIVFVATRFSEKELPTQFWHCCPDQGSKRNSSCFTLAWHYYFLCWVFSKAFWWSSHLRALEILPSRALHGLNLRDSSQVFWFGIISVALSIYHPQFFCLWKE